MNLDILRDDVTGADIDALFGPDGGETPRNGHHPSTELPDERTRRGDDLPGAGRALVLAVPGAVAETAYRLPDGLSYAEWEAVGRDIQRAGRRLQWIAGDWIVYGEDRWPDIYAQAIDATGYAVQTLMNAASVCRAIPPEARRSELPFTHHAELASLMREDAEAALHILGVAAEAVAAGGEVSSREVREAVRTYREQRGLLPMPPYKPETEPCAACNGTGKVPAAAPPGGDGGRGGAPAGPVRRPRRGDRPRRLTTTMEDAMEFEKPAPVEARILAVLADAGPGRFVSTEDVCRRVWTRPVRSDSLCGPLRRLRRKVPGLVESARGFGYRLTGPIPAAYLPAVESARREPPRVPIRDGRACLAKRSGCAGCCRVVAGTIRAGLTPVPKPRRPAWTTQEDDLLRALWARTRDLEEIGAQITRRYGAERTAKATRERARLIGLWRRDDLFTTGEVARMLGVARPRVSEWAMRGVLGARRVGAGTRSPFLSARGDVERLVDARPDLIDWRAVRDPQIQVRARAAAIRASRLEATG